MLLGSRLRERFRIVVVEDQFVLFNTSMRYSTRPTARRLGNCSLLITAGALVLSSAYAVPSFTASSSGTLSAQIGFDDLNNPGFSGQVPTVGFGTPESLLIQGGRNSGMITTGITQIAPYILGGDYWAGTWNATVAATPGAGGLFGVRVGAGYAGFWYFGIDGKSNAEVAATTFYYAAKWTTSENGGGIMPDISVGGPGGIGRILHSPAHPPPVVTPSGSFTGSFKLSDFNAPNVTSMSFAVGLNPHGLLQVLPNNLESSLDFSFSIAFSTTPIDADVFAPSVDEATHVGASLFGAVGLIVWMRNRRTGLPTTRSSQSSENLT